MRNEEVYTFVKIFVLQIYLEIAISTLPPFFEFLWKLIASARDTDTILKLCITFNLHPLHFTHTPDI